MYAYVSDFIVLFQIMTTSPEKYFVRPNNGFLSPGSTCDVEGAVERSLLFFSYLFPNEYGLNFSYVLSENRNLREDVGCSHLSSLKFSPLGGMCHEFTIFTASLYVFISIFKINASFQNVQQFLGNPHF